MKRKTSLLLASLCGTLLLQAHENEERVDTLHEVVITGTNNATERSRIPYSVSTVTHDQIEATGGTQLLSALSGRIPGLFVTQRNIFGFGVSKGGSGGIKLRGVGGSPTSQVLMMVDGKPQFAGVFSHPVADNYESEYVDHVEIVRGPASVLYGSNAMGGAINLITRKQQEQGTHTAITSQYGSYNTWQTRFTNTNRYGKFSSLLSAGFDRTDGTQKHFDFKQKGFYLKLGYDFSEHWNLYADYSFMRFKGNDPIYAKTDTVSDNDDDIYHQNVVRGEASAVAGNRYDKTNGAVRVYSGHGNNKISDPTDFQMLDNRVGVLAYQNWQPWQGTNFTLGFDFDRYTGKVPLSGGVWRKDKVTPTTMDRQGITEYSPYVSASQSVWRDIVVLNAGLRMANSNKFGTHWVPQGGISVNPGCGFNIKSSISKGYRNPSLKEMYLFMIANPDLNPEEMVNYEVSVGKRFDRWLSVELTGYISKGRNLISQDADQGKKYFNTGDFRNRGLEFTATSHPLDNLMLRTTYSCMTTDISNLTGAPKHQYSVGVDWTALPKLIVNADLTGVSRLYVASKVDKQNYALLNLRLTYKPFNFLDLFAQGSNLTNARYCINYGYTMPGATVMGGFKVKF